VRRAALYSFFTSLLDAPQAVLLVGGAPRAAKKRPMLDTTVPPDPAFFQGSGRRRAIYRPKTKHPTR
jgi:hypothetical protein